MHLIPNLKIFNQGKSDVIFCVFNNDLFTFFFFLFFALIEIIFLHGWTKAILGSAAPVTDFFKKRKKHYKFSSVFFLWISLLLFHLVVVNCLFLQPFFLHWSVNASSTSELSPVFSFSSRSYAKLAMTRLSNFTAERQKNNATSAFNLFSNCLLGTKRQYFSLPSPSVPHQTTVAAVIQD